MIYAMGGLFGLATLDGVYKSIDGGATWTRVFATVPYTSSVQSLAVDPTNASIVYAATENDGVYKTIDGGVTWAHSDTGITDNGYAFGGPSMAQVVVDPLTPTTVFAIAYGNVGIFKSTDSGGSWAPSNTGVPTPSGPGLMFIDPQNPSTIYLLHSEGLRCQRHFSESRRLWSQAHPRRDGSPRRRASRAPRTPVARTARVPLRSTSRHLFTPSRAPPDHSGAAATPAG